MKTLYNYILEASLLGDIDDILADGDEYAQKREIVDWLKENGDLVYAFTGFRENENLFKNPTTLNIDSKGQIDLNVFRPFYSYAPKDKQFMTLPIPEYVKLNNVNAYDFVGNKQDLSQIDFNKLPHINKCKNMILRCWNGRHNKWVPSLSKLNIDEISVLTVDIEGVHPQEWPKKNINVVYLFANTITDYSEDYVEELGYNYNLHNLNGLSTDELIVPDCCITENIALILTQNAVKKDIVIDKETHPYEWQNINLIFESKSFKKLYTYSAASHVGDHRFKEIKKLGNTFVIKGRATNVLNKYRE